jgi:hypothetical protein
LEENISLEKETAERSAALERAARAYLRCLTKGGQIWACETMPGATDWAASTRLGTVRLIQRDAKKARASFEAALAVLPGHNEARLGLIEADILDDRVKDALKALEPHLREETPDAWVLAAFAASRMQLASDAVLFATEAIHRASRVSMVAPHRRLLLSELGNSLRISGPSAQ